MSNRDIAFLSRRIGQGIYKVLKINLMEDSFEIIKAPEEELVEEKGYADTISGWFHGFCEKGLIYKDDVDRFQKRTDLKFLRTFFQKEDKTLSVWYRRMMDSGYRWVVMKMIRAEKYTADSQIILLYVQDDDDDQEELEASAQALEQQHLWKALGSIYLTMHMLDLKRDTLVEFNTTSPISEYVNQKNNIVKQMKDVIEHTVVKEQLKEALEFTDLTTITERMKECNSLSSEFFGVHFGWFRTQFVVINRDGLGKIETVLFTTEVIDKAKKREEQLIRMSNTDELTQLWNRHCYETDIISFENKIEKEFAIVAMDLNGLKMVNDHLGHEAGDELIRAAAECMRMSFGESGKVYRTGGDEFIAILFCDEETLLSHKKSFKEKAKQWVGKYHHGVSVSCGTVCRKEFPTASFHEMEMMADRRMYDEKTQYYRENGLDRRKY